MAMYRRWLLDSLVVLNCPLPKYPATDMAINKLRKTLEAGRLTYPAVLEVGPGRVKDTSIYPPEKQNLFQLCNMPERNERLCAPPEPEPGPGPSSIRMTSFPSRVVTCPGSYHSYEECYVLAEAEKTLT